MPALKPQTLQPGELMRAGDIVLTRENGVFGYMIRWGTRTGQRGINHACVVVIDQENTNDSVRTVEAMFSGVVETVRPKLTGYVVRLSDDPAVAAQIVDVARSYLGTPYDWVGIARFAAVCMRLRWWGKPIAALLDLALPDHDDGTRVFCSDHVSQVVTTVFGDLGMGPGYAISPVDLLRSLMGYGCHIDGSNTR